MKAHMCNLIHFSWTHSPPGSSSGHQVNRHLLLTRNEVITSTACVDLELHVHDHETLSWSQLRRDSSF